MKPSLARIERFVEDMERRLVDANVIRPRCIRLIVDGQTPQEAVDEHIRKHPTDASCDFIVRAIIEPEPRQR